MYFAETEERYAWRPSNGLGFYRDPVYGHIPLSPVIREAVDLPPMQRLRHMKQLGTLYLVFEGATHTRLGHSLGVYFLASRALEVLRNRHLDLITPEIQLAVQLAALFHDVGHGPFSHVFQFFSTREQGWGDKDEKNEDRKKRPTYRLISEGIGNFDDIPQFLERLENHLIKKGGSKKKEAKILNPENVAALAVGLPPACKEEYKFLSDIISCDEFDVDRLDYLRRDALFTGTSIGTIDPWEIINNLCIARQDGELRLMVFNQAATAIEAMLAARDFAYRRVYHDPTNRVAQEMIVKAMHDYWCEHEKVEKKGPTDADKDRWGLFTDNELIRFLSQQTLSPIAKDLALRIQMRALYQLLPFNVHLNEESAKKALRNYWEALDDVEWQQGISAILRERGFEDRWTVLCDVETLPVSRIEEYRRLFLIDIDTGERRSLTQELPHIEYTRGDYHFRNGMVASSSDLFYAGSFPKVAVSLPFEYIQKLIEDVEPAPTTEGDSEDVTKTTYEYGIKPVLDNILKRVLQNIKPFPPWADLEKNIEKRIGLFLEKTRKFLMND